MKLKKGDTIIVIAGKDKGRKGNIVQVLPRENLVVVDGINMMKKHRRRTAATRSGQIVEKAMPIHASNVQLADPKTGKPTRIAITRSKDGSRERVAKKSKQALK